jgi:transcription elongation factor GreA
MHQVLLTKDGYAQLREELENLEARRLSLVEGTRQALAEGGVRAENGAYFDAMREAALLESRIGRLEQRLRQAEVIEAARDGEVEVGERVTVLDLTSAVTFDYRIVGSGEANPAAGEISHASPIGAALLGRRVGDVVEVEVPAGLARLEVVEIDG